MPVDIRRISLEEEYKKETGITPEDIRKLKQWLETQPHLPKEHITELDLILAYHSCDCSAEVTKQVLDLHYTLRTLFTPLFKDRLIDKTTEKTLDVIAIRGLPVRSKDGYAVFYGRLIDFEPKNYDFTKSIRTVLMLLDLWAHEEGTWPGFIMIFDLYNLKLGHLSKLDLQTTQQFLYYLQEAMFVKMRGLHFMNAPSFMDKFLMIIKPFMKKELIEMLHIHQSGADSLNKFVPVAALPKEAGGESATLAECREIMLGKLRANKEFFVEENKKRVVESKRPGKPKTITDIFGGVDGSFKKLDID